MNEPDIDNKKGVSPVWILPVLAFCIVGWLIYHHITTAGIDITVSFKDAVGITAEKTPVLYRGNQVGIVKAVTLGKDLKSVELSIEMERSTAPYLVKDMKFWVEKVSVEAGRIIGLDTLISGSYIGLQPGVSTEPERCFTGLPGRPPVAPNTPGLHLVFMADALYSLQVGSGIYHRGIMIGSVQEYHMQEDETVRINAFIEPEYQALVKKKSRFWNASGLMISGGVADLKIHLQSLATLIKGGIVMDTPDELAASNPAENGQEFCLYKDFDDAEYGIPLTLQLTSGRGIYEGSTQVVYRGMKVGVVKSIVLNEDAQHSVSAKVLLDPRVKSILKTGTQFYLVQAELSLNGAKNLETLVTGAYISFVPGEGEYRDHFNVATDAYAFQVPQGTRFTLTAPDAGSLSVGAPVFFKRFQVGEVIDFNLSEDAAKVDIGVLIYKRYARHVLTSTRFYNLSGVEVKANLSGLQIQTGSLQSIISGGIAFYSPKDGPTAKPKTQFPLYANRDAAVDSDRVKITINFKQSDGLKVGTAIKYRGIQIGRVTCVNYSKNYRSATAEAMLEPKASGLLRNSTKFWLVRGSLSLSGSKHVETLLTGPFIQMSAGWGKARRKFQALATPPLGLKQKDGLTLILEADSLNSLEPGSPVYYRRMVVGEVLDYRLSSTFQKVDITVCIQKPYKAIIRENTRFWNASGVQVHGGIFSGVTLNTQSLQSIMAGGICLATPNNEEMGAFVTNGHHFALFSEAEEKWLEWNPVIMPEKQ